MGRKLNAQSKIIPSHSASLFTTGIFVALATFVMSVSLITVYNTGSAVFDDHTGQLIYIFCIFAWAAGFPAYSFIDRFIKAATVRQATLVSAAILCIIAFSNTAFAYSGKIYGFTSMLGLFLFGVLFAAVYHKTAIRMNGSPYTGRLVGISIAGIELAIWPVVSLIADAAVTYLTVSAALIGISLYARIPASPVSGNRPKPAEPDGKQRRMLIALVAAAALIAVMVAMTENIFLNHIASDQIKMQDWPRLLHAASILLLGFLADIKKRRYLTLTTFCIILLFSVGVIVWDGAYPLGIAMCVYYVFRATGIMFFTVSFLDIAPDTKNPGLWSSFGRLSNAVTEAAMLFALLFLRLNLLSMIVISLLCAMSLFLVLLWGRLFVQKTDSAPESSASAFGQALDEIIVSYGITNREAEVLRLLLDAKNTAGIAAEMTLTEKTVQNYVNALLSKTESKSRGEMIAKFSRAILPDL
jgi:DNA-binding CsgD family transcriptional regulator